MPPRNQRSKVSAGLLMFRRAGDHIQVLLAHPGGPFFARKDEGAWTIPKGLIEGDDEPLATAIREFGEETALTPPAPADGPYIPLETVTQPGGKVVHAWAIERDVPAGWTLKSNTFEMEWPPKSGSIRTFPEIDRAEFFDIAVARRKINPAQIAFIDRLEAAIAR